jgi:hypothetical protein
MHSSLPQERRQASAPDSGYAAIAWRWHGPFARFLKSGANLLSAHGGRQVDRDGSDDAMVPTAICVSDSAPRSLRTKNPRGERSGQVNMSSRQESLRLSRHALMQDLTGRLRNRSVRDVPLLLFPKANGRFQMHAILWIFHMHGASDERLPRSASERPSPRHAPVARRAA